MRRRSVAWLLAVVAVIAMAVLVALTVVVTTHPSLALDSRAFHIANEVGRRVACGAYSDTPPATATSPRTRQTY